jgi:hypothetical protein
MQGQHMPTYTRRNQCGTRSGKISLNPCKQQQRLLSKMLERSGTTYDNLNQWFDDVKKDFLLATGLVENEIVYDEEGEMVSEMQFKRHSE